MDKVLLFGENESNSLAIQVMKEKYGEDIQVVTIDEANEMGLTPEDFRNIPRYEITRPNRMLSDQIPFIESKRVGKGGRAKNRKALKNTSFLALFLFYPQRFRIFVETHKEMEKPKRAYVHPLLICPYDPEQEYSKCCAPRRVKCTCALRRKGTGNHYE